MSNPIDRGKCTTAERELIEASIDCLEMVTVGSGDRWERAAQAVLNERKQLTPDQRFEARIRKLAEHESDTASFSRRDLLGALHALGIERELQRGDVDGTPAKR